MTAMLFDFPEPPRKIGKPKKEPKPSGYTEEFEAFWARYPRKLNCSKFEASKSWARLPIDMQAQAGAALPVFVRMMAGKEEQFICHAATWLNQRRFETITPPKAPDAAPVSVDWPVALKIYAATGRWNRDFGPEPGMKGYLGPTSII